MVLSALPILWLHDVVQIVVLHFVVVHFQSGAKCFMVVGAARHPTGILTNSHNAKASAIQLHPLVRAQRAYPGSQNVLRQQRFCNLQMAPLRRWLIAKVRLRMHLPINAKVASTRPSFSVPHYQ